MRKYILAVLAVAFSLTVNAQMSQTQKIINATLKGWQLELRAGYNLGGTAPVPLPEEIRSMDSYSPKIPFTIEADFLRFFGEKKKWGLSWGVKLENKAMDTKATVKNYGMEIFGDEGERVAGRWTGGVRTKVDNSYLTFPILAVYKVHPRTNIRAGVYLSYMIDGEFSGYVYDGYLRQEDPTGLKVPYGDGKTASYDFSDELRKFQCGAQLGVDWMAFKHLKVFADLTWGLNDIFNNDFKTITFSMYPIYFNFGLGYLF